MNKFVNNKYNDNNNQDIDEDELLMCNSFLKQIENSKSNFKLSSSNNLLINNKNESSLSSINKILVDTSNLNKSTSNSNKNGLNNSITSKILNDKLSASKSFDKNATPNSSNHVIIFFLYYNLDIRVNLYLFYFKIM
jgi:hypothetical protein